MISRQTCALGCISRAEIFGIDLCFLANWELSRLHLDIDIRQPFAYAPGMAITRRQRELYDFISRFVAEKQYSPSFEEIKEAMGLNSLATVHKHVTNLEKKGLLTRDYNRSRSIDLLPPRGKLKQSMAVNTAMVLPLVGRIAAGRPIEAVEHLSLIHISQRRESQTK